MACASNSTKECNVCKEEFNEDENCPRNLPCSHCICTKCIKELINRNLKRCPYCRSVFAASSYEDIGINTVCLDLLKYIKEIEAKAALPAKISPVSRSDLLEALKKNYAETHNQHIQSFQNAEGRLRNSIESNSRLQHRILENHMILINDIINKTKDQADKCLHEVEYLKNENSKLQRQLKEIQRKKREHLDFKQDLDGTMALTKIDSILEAAEQSNAASQDWLERFDKQLSSEDEIKQHMDKVAEFSEGKLISATRMLSTQDAEEANLRKLLVMKFIKEIPVGQSLVGTLQRKEYFIKYLMKRDGIYAVQLHNSKTRYGKMSISEDKVFLHCLREERPSNVCTLQHRDAMALYDSSAKTVFLDFGTAESTLGRIMISLTSNTKRSQNFTHLCTGAMGASYLNTVIYDVWHKDKAGERIKCGDYENNDGSGGKALVQGAGKEFGGILQQPASEGFVTGLLGLSGDAVASQFAIVTKTDPDDLLSAAFGKLESGLYILTNVILRYPNLSDVYIKDCGIVLPI